MLQASNGTSLAKDLHMGAAADNTHKAAQPLTPRTDVLPLWVLCRNPFRADDTRLVRCSGNDIFNPLLHLLSGSELKRIDSLLKAVGLPPFNSTLHSNRYMDSEDRKRIQHEINQFAETIAGLVILRLPPEHVTSSTLGPGHVWMGGSVVSTFK